MPPPDPRITRLPRPAPPPSIAGWAGLLVLAALLIAPGTARAAACCLSAGVFGVGRLVIWEEFAVGTSVGMARAHGVWGSDGTLHPYDSGYSEQEATADIYAIARIDERFQAWARVPWLVTMRSAGGRDEVGNGVGDVQAGLRFDAVQIGEYEELPAIAFTASVLAPTGMRPEDAATSLGTGTSGRGVWAAALSVSFEHVRAPWFVRFDVGGSVTASFVRKDLGVKQAYGPGLQLGLSAGRELIPDKWVLALGLSQEFEAPLSIDGETVDDSAARSLGTTLSSSFNLSPHWMLQASVTNSVWPDGFGTNRLARYGGSIGVRYGYF